MEQKVHSIVEEKLQQRWLSTSRFMGLFTTKGFLLIVLLVEWNLWRREQRRGPSMRDLWVSTVEFLSVEHKLEGLTRIFVKD